MNSSISYLCWIFVEIMNIEQNGKRGYYFSSFGITLLNLDQTGWLCPYDWLWVFFFYLPDLFHTGMLVTRYRFSARNLVHLSSGACRSSPRFCQICPSFFISLSLIPPRCDLWGSTLATSLLLHLSDALLLEKGNDSHPVMMMPNLVFFITNIKLQTLPRKWRQCSLNVWMSLYRMPY